MPSRNQHELEQAIVKRNRMIAQLQDQLAHLTLLAQQQQAHNAQLARTFGAILLETAGPNVEVRLTTARVQELEEHPMRYVLEQRQDPDTKELIFQARQRTDEEIAALKADREKLAAEVAEQNESQGSGLVDVAGAPLRETAGKLHVIQ